MAKITNADLLLAFKAAMQEQRSAPPSRRAVRNKVERRKGHRMQSRRQAAALKMTPNLVKAGYQSAEEVEWQWRGIKAPDETRTTRNVGPSDLDQNYTSGKNTSYRTF